METTKKVLELNHCWKQNAGNKYSDTGITKHKRILWNREAVSGDRKLNGAIYRDHVCSVHRVELNSIRKLIRHTSTLTPKFSYF